MLNRIPNLGALGLAITLLVVLVGSAFFLVLSTLTSLSQRQTSVSSELQKQQLENLRLVIDQTTQRVERLKENKRCFTGDFLVDAGEMGGTARVGQIQMCGKDLEFTGAYGPDFATWIEHVDQRNNDLQEYIEEHIPGGIRAFLEWQSDQAKEQQALP